MLKCVKYVIVMITQCIQQSEQLKKIYSVPQIKTVCC